MLMFEKNLITQQMLDVTEELMLIMKINMQSGSGWIFPLHQTDKASQSVSTFVATAL